MIKLDLEKAEETDQIVIICCIIEKAREFQKNICFTDYAKVFDSVDHNKLWEILQEMGISSVAQSCPTLCDPIDCSTPGFPVLHQFLELAQTHTH